MTTKRTPAPWAYDTYMGEVYYDGGVDGDPAPTVAAVVCDEDGPLLAAAPDLYEALTGLIYGADETTKERARAKAISAIARVEGQQ